MQANADTRNDLLEGNHEPVSGRRANEVLVDTGAFELAVQPFTPPHISVGVGQERAVLERDRLGHRPTPSSCQRLECCFLARPRGLVSAELRAALARR